MIVFMVLVGVALVGGWMLARRRRRSTLAGLRDAAPVFHVEPGRRRVIARRQERL